MAAAIGLHGREGWRELMSHRDVGLEPVPDWEQIPEGIQHRDVPAVSVDPRDRVYLFTRLDHQVLVYTPGGEFIKAWGNGLFKNAHGIKIGPDGAVYTVDNGDHTVRKFSPDGDLLLTIGTPGRPSDTGYRTDTKPKIHNNETVVRAGGPFNSCTDVAIAPDGDLYVSDGYGNCRIHHFDASGNLLHSWGEVGTEPGQFQLPHGIALSADGRVFVNDRENDRIQIFSPDGEYLEEWDDFYRPCALAFDAQGRLFVGELWRPADNRSFVRDTIGTDLPSRMTVLSPTGEVITRWGDSTDDKKAPGAFIAPHGIAFDSTGSLYVGEVTYTYGIKFGRVSADHAPYQIRKYEPITTETR
jgi:DNA-binding beta-propeller fold protein YncE